MKKTYKIIRIIIIIIFLISLGISARILAEKFDETPDSNSTSNIKELYDHLVELGYGDENTGGLGAYLNRIKSASEWFPNGDITDDDIVNSKEYINGDRLKRISESIWGNYTKQICNYASPTILQCASQRNIVTYIQTGTAASVTDNGIKRSISNNTVHYDPLTKLYWSSASANVLDNEFSYVNGDDRVNPTGASCNFNSAGNANQYCDNQDPTNSYVEDNDVSAAEFCLNLQLDADNADGDLNGTTGVETDWRLPSVKEVFQAMIDGISTRSVMYEYYAAWTSTEDPSNQGYAYAIPMTVSAHLRCMKNATGGNCPYYAYAICVRRAN